MNRMLGAPSFARSGLGHAGLETSNVRPMTPLNAVPGLYSLRVTSWLLIGMIRLPKHGGSNPFYRG